MSIIPRVSRHSLVAGLSVAALAVAGSVAATAGAGPAHAASCSAGYVGLTTAACFAHRAANVLLHHAVRA